MTSQRRRSRVTVAAAVASAAALLAGTGGSVALATGASAAESAAQAAPVADVPDNHGIADLIALVDQLLSDGKIPAHAHASLMDRLQRALAQEQAGSEVRTIGLLEQFIARANNQIKGDAEDLETRALLVERAEAAIAWLEFDEAAEASGSAQLQEDVTLEGVMRHLRKFQEIADANGGNRFAGSPGYDASAEYVHDLLDEAGYDVSYQEFTYQLGYANFAQVTPDAASYGLFSQFYVGNGSGQGDVTATVVPVDIQLPPGNNTSTSGCEAADFAGFMAGSIALVQRGTCDFAVKARNAQAAGAAAVIIMNEGTPGDPSRNGVVNPNVGAGITIPAVGTTFAIGRDLMEPAGTTARVRYQIETLPTRNVIAETPGGNADNVVMLGGHLDGVDDGPGINDNGTGTAAQLETALQMADDEVNNKVRFAFWSAEESGLLGSNYYVAQLPQAERDKIALYLNFDMIGSPNYFRGVYDGTGTLGGTAPRPVGSAAIEELFNTHFGFEGLPYEDTEFSGRSDYQAFILNDIPSGGLFTGAEVPKTAAQVERYGGVAGASYDPCYHQSCDSFTPLEDGANAATYAALLASYGDQLVGNVNTYALDTSADAIAHAAATYADSTVTVNGVE